MLMVLLKFSETVSIMLHVCFVWKTTVSLNAKIAKYLFYFFKIEWYGYIMTEMIMEELALWSNKSKN
jgi:hypothetical protein